MQDSFPGVAKFNRFSGIRKRESGFWRFRTGFLAGRRRISGQLGIQPSRGSTTLVHGGGRLRQLLHLGLVNESAHIEVRPVEAFAHLFDR